MRPKLTIRTIIANEMLNYMAHGIIPTDREQLLDLYDSFHDRHNGDFDLVTNIPQKEIVEKAFNMFPFIEFPASELQGIFRNRYI